MKKILLFIIALSISQITLAQIIFNRSDYDLEPGDTVFSRLLLPNAVAIPQEGADQVWDYSNLVFDLGVGNIEDIGTHPDFPGANIIEMVEVPIFGPLAQETHFIEQLDDQGHRVLGREVFPRKNSLSFITGGQFDSLNLLGGVCVYEEPLYDVKFPLVYEDSFSSRFTIHTPFEVNLPIVNFQQDTGAQVAHLDYQFAVSGWGNITIANPFGEGQRSFDALLLKREQTRVDSFFVNNEPLNEIILAFFGLAQGITTEITTYSFWVPGLNRSALSINVNRQTGGVASASVAAIISELISTSTHFPSALKDFTVAPNPARDFFNISFEKIDHEDWVFSVFNGVGQEVLSTNISGPKGRTIATIRPQSKLNRGMYYYLLKNGKGWKMAGGKIMINH